MARPTRWSSLSEPLRGAGYVLGLGVLITLVAAVIAALLVWALT